MSASLRKRPNCCVAAKRRYVPKPEATTLFITVGAGEHRGRDGEAHRFCGLQVDGELIIGRRLNRKFFRLLPLENAIDIAGSKPRYCEQIGSIRYQTTMIHPGPMAVDRGQSILSRQFDDEVTVPDLR